MRFWTYLEMFFFFLKILILMKKVSFFH